MKYNIYITVETRNANDIQIATSQVEARGVSYQHAQGLIQATFTHLGDNQRIQDLKLEKV